MPSEMDDFLFDLRGYLILEQALSSEEVAELNVYVDRLVEEQDAPGSGLPESPGYEQFGRLIQNVVEAGEPFERLIDHPSWSEHLRRYIGRTDRPVLDDSAAILRGQGQASKLHSGAHKRRNIHAISLSQRRISLWRDQYYHRTERLALGRRGDRGRARQSQVKYHPSCFCNSGRQTGWIG